MNLIQRFLFRLVSYPKLTYGVLVVLTVIGYFHFPESNKTFDFWEIISTITKAISDKNIPSYLNGSLLFLIVLIIPYIILNAIYMFILPVSPKEILKEANRNGKNTLKLSYANLQTHLEDCLKEIRAFGGEGALVSQEHYNRMQKIVLDKEGFIKELFSKQWFITSLLEPDELWKDNNHKTSIELTVINAKRRNVSLERYIVTSDISEERKKVSQEGTAIREISKLHADNKHKLYLIDKDKFTQLSQQCGINKDCLDFLLVENNVVIGMKNNADFTIYTENENYKLFLKDDPEELKNYRELINFIKPIRDDLIALYKP